MKEKLSRLMKMGKMVLFHKKRDKKDLANYRPITMLNSDYKIVAKVLANRLQKVIGNLIDESQTGFVRGRRIEGNIMEVYLVCERNRQKRVIVLMNFEKVYDRVDRRWMEKCMRKVGLLNRYIQWCMETVVNVKTVIEEEEVL
jgi:Reverse transcriptase (RNA-dependent DNA polymerase)